MSSSVSPKFDDEKRELNWGLLHAAKAKSYCRERRLGCEKATMEEAIAALERVHPELMMRSFIQKWWRTESVTKYFRSQLSDVVDEMLDKLIESETGELQLETERGVIQMKWDWTMTGPNGLMSLDHWEGSKPFKDLYWDYAMKTSRIKEGKEIWFTEEEVQEFFLGAAPESLVSFLEEQSRAKKPIPGLAKLLQQVTSSKLVGSKLSHSENRFHRAAADLQIVVYHGFDVSSSSERLSLRLGHLQRVAPAQTLREGRLRARRLTRTIFRRRRLWLNLPPYHGRPSIFIDNYSFLPSLRHQFCPLQISSPIRVCSANANLYMFVVLHDSLLQLVLSANLSLGCNMGGT